MLSQVVVGLPFGLAQLFSTSIRASRAGQDGGSFSKCSNHFRRLFVMLILQGVIWSSLESFIFVSLSCHLILSIFLSIFHWNLSTRSAIFFVIIHNLELYRNTDSTYVLKALFFNFLDFLVLTSRRLLQVPCIHATSATSTKVTMDVLEQEFAHFGNLTYWSWIMHQLLHQMNFRNDARNNVSPTSVKFFTIKQQT